MDKKVFDVVNETIVSIIECIENNDFDAVECYTMELTGMKKIFNVLNKNPENKKIMDVINWGIETGYENME